GEYVKKPPVVRLVQFLYQRRRDTQVDSLLIAFSRPKNKNWTNLKLTVAQSSYMPLAQLA
ncbi:MAG: hypothetical protein KDJ65_01410, partial [Anaerolineae bacterium]|nr:hypothetical protein [Anaerolineae bacterium]